MALHTFIAGESALVAENLDANFQYLLGLIQSGGTGGSLAATTGTSSTNYLGHINGIGTGAVTGVGTAFGFSFSNAQNVGQGAATGAAGGTVIGASLGASPGTATGTSTAVSFENAGTTATAAATGSESASYIGSDKTNSVAVTTGTGTTTAVSARQIAYPGTASGSATVLGVGQGSAVESLNGATNVGPTSPIFASTTPGTASGSLNSFALTASPGIIVVNGTNDTSIANGTAVELYYNATLHTIYVENNAGSWWSWASANTWTAASSPVPVVIEESVEGTSYTTAGPIIYASSVPGTAAPANSTVGNGLDTWAMTANPGLLIHNGTTDTNTANVVQMYYTGHSLWQLNSSGSWYAWTGNLAVNNGYTAGTTTSPIPTTSALNIAIIPNQNVNQTYTVHGTYQAYAGGGTPTLQYADNVTGGTGTTTTWSASDKSTTMTLTNSNQTATTTLNAASSSVRSTTSYSTGKRMFEITASTITSNWECGIATAAFGLATGLGDDPNGFGIQPNQGSGAQTFIYNGNILSSIATSHFSANGDKITICVDFGAQLLWATSAAMRAAGFPWNNAVIGSQNPATGTGGFSFAGMSGAGLICFNEFDSGGVAILNTLGPFAVAIPSGFSSWDVSSSTTWQALPSNTNVTTTTWSFVHPPVATQNAAANVGIRDANSTGITATSNTFQISTPGVVTLGAMTSTPSAPSITAGQASGTLVSTITIPASGGTFTGTVASSNSNFQVTGSGGSRSLVTTAVLGAGSVSTTLTATMAGAVNTGETLVVNITISAESASATAVTTAGANIVGSNTPGVAGSQLTWALVAATGGNAPFEMTLAGVTQTATGTTSELYYINHTLYRLTSAAAWSYYNGSAISGGQVATGNFTSCSTPIPNITLSGLTFPPLTNGFTQITASLISASAALPNVTWTEDSASFNFQNGNQIWTVGSLPAGSYPVNITATIS